MIDDSVEKATRIDPSDAPSGSRLDGRETYSQYYQRLSNWNSLRWNGKWMDQNRQTERDHVSLLESLASKLELTDYQKTEAKRLLRELPSDRFRAYSNVAVVLLICGYIGSLDGRDTTPEAIRDSNSSTFVELAEGVGLQYSTAKSLWHNMSEVYDG